MKASELKDKSIEELQAMLLDERRDQFNLRMRKGTGQLEKPHKVKEARRNIARIHTMINQKKASAAGEKA